MPNVRTVVCFLIAGVLAVAVASIAGSAFAAPGWPAGTAASNLDKTQQSTRTTGAVTSGLAVSIDSVSPQFATTANATITVTGTITNDTGRPLDGVQVQLETSPSHFLGRSDMSQYSSGQYWQVVPVTGTPWYASGTLHSHSTMSWTASFAAGQQGYEPYEVYPVEAWALSSGLTTLGAARTFLPYWPGSGPSSPDKLAISWIWPLMDSPQQGACDDDLATNELASSLGAGGRLSGLLDAGLQYADATSLTWAVDPALLADATIMTKPRYKVGGNGICTDTTAMPSSGAASTWLDDLRGGTINQPMFVTPYADPDVSALVHSGLDADLVNSYFLGDNVADEVLHRSFGSGAPVAWPAGGSADASVLTSLARDGDVKTTVLNSGEMPALGTASTAYPPDDATASVTTGITTTMGVLLADNGITADLGSATAQSPASAQFGVEQDFLAQTAMIAAEAPNTARSVVIAPPQRWDPSEGEAAGLLKLTSAPWLRPVALSTLASQAGEHPSATARQSLPGSQVAPGELSANYMSTVESVRNGASRYESMLSQPSAQTIETAIAVTESSAWRGQASKGGRLALDRLSTFFSHREKLVQIISKNKVVLAGTSGVIPVSVANGLDATVRVQVRPQVPAGSQLTIGKFDSTITILPGQTRLVRLPVHAATLGSISMQLELVAPNGSPLGTTQSLSIEPTRFGRALLIVIAAALGVLVLSSLARWVRRSWRENISEADGRSGGTG